MKPQYEIEISNHKVFTDVERVLQIMFPQPNSYNETFEIMYMIKHVKNGIDVSHEFSQVYAPWKLSNNDLMMERDLATKLPIPNPDYNPEDEIPSSEYLMKPAFDYLIYLVYEVGVPLPVLFDMYVPEEDADGRFDR